ncbi:LacI family DNA-binding transcriptional regulator [Isoptericola sp. BMS4]|uniref:LacI family DNA-binding transcriptional regulator n=1 Tax=Isoptericola sp. BMS4 TaxID=2527875 RepID=UPI0014226498|nr:LacI family DNA-binding transcriptional regulator [Isoptericola sp. BMS4]
MSEPARPEPRRRKRATIADIAERAGVTSSAVSLAVNGKRGVSDATRARILEVARELNWRPSHAAQALMGKGAEAVGLVLARPPEVIGEEIFFAKFIAGVQASLSERGYSLLLQMAQDMTAEITIHAGWIADGRVDGSLVLDPRIDDPRIKSLAGLDHPTVVVGGDIDQGSVRSLRVDNGAAMRLVMEHLDELGHARIAFVTGDQNFRHTQERMDAFSQFCIDRGIWGQSLAANFDPSMSRSATARLMSSPHPPTAIVYDSDVMTVAGLGELTALGYAVPRDVSVVSWEDSATCQVLHPTVTALNRDAVSLGRMAAAEMLELLDHQSVEHSPVEVTVVARESTAAPARS